MESSLKNMVAALGVITLVCSAAVGVVYGLTKAPIEAARRAKTTGALALVLPPFEGEPLADTLPADGMPSIVYTARKDGKIVGYAVESATNKGFGGEIRLMTGFTPGGEIVKIEVLRHNETPGLGDKIEAKKSDFCVQFQGKTPGKDFRMSVKKDGGEVDAITASTISSRAYIDAVQRAWNALQTVTTGAAPATDGDTGASSPAQAAPVPAAKPEKQEAAPAPKPAREVKKTTEEPDANSGATAQTDGGTGDE